jgi:hypothetical protein
VGIGSVPAGREPAELLLLCNTLAVQSNVAECCGPTRPLHFVEHFFEIVGDSNALRAMFRAALFYSPHRHWICGNDEMARTSERRPVRQLT